MVDIYRWHGGWAFEQKIQSVEGVELYSNLYRTVFGTKMMMMAAAGRGSRSPPKTSSEIFIIIYALSRVFMSFPYALK